MWIFCFFASVLCLALAIIFAFSINKSNFVKKHKIGTFKSLFAGVFGAVVLSFYPIHFFDAEQTLLGAWRAFLLSLFNSMQVFTIGCDFNIVKNGMGGCPDFWYAGYLGWAATLFVIAPVFTFGFVLSLFKNWLEYIKYLLAFFKDVYIFSELNDKSLTLASDIKRNHKNAAIVFTDVFEKDEEKNYELIENAAKIRAICFKNDILVVDFKKHSSKKSISFFTIGMNETENLNQSLKLIENYRERKNTHIFVFSTKLESRLLLSDVDKGEIKVRRINEAQSLVNSLLYEHGETLFESAKECEDGSKHISAIVVGMGRHGTEMVKSLAWFCQMDGYSIEINAFDKDPLAEDRFKAAAPELMSPEYNGVMVDGEAQYKINIHAGVDVETLLFEQKIAQIKNATYVIVALGNDDVNINTSVNLRMYFERMKIDPVIHSIIYNSRQKKALDGLKNYRGQKYRIEFIGDIDSSYTEAVIIDSELENDALQRHLKWGKEEEFWNYEYNYRSSIASAIHMKARIKCGIPGSAKEEDELTDEERQIIESLEHRRWNAYMRSEGYIYSGSNEKSSRNDLGKMHNDLVCFDRLSDEEKRKDSKIGTN